MQKKTTKLGQLFEPFVACKVPRTVLPGGKWRWLVSMLVLWLSVNSLAQPGDGAANSVDAQPETLAPQPALRHGQSATLLSDGRWLLLGGIDEAGNPSSEAVILSGRAGSKAILETKPTKPRSEHTATLLPDGMVLILGGIDANGVVLTSAEQFDPATGQFHPLGDLGVIARAGHTATVLADGNLLISGGYDQHAHIIFESEIYHPLTGKVENFSVKLNTARMNHIAALLPSADVLLWGGVDSGRKRLEDGEVFEFSQQRFNTVTMEEATELSRSLFSSGAPVVKDSQPAAEAEDVAVDKPLMVHFSQRMAVASLNSASVTLIGPNGTVPIKVVPVENGLLLFVTPRQDLLPLSRYTLFIRGATNDLGQQLAFTAIGFNTMQLVGQNVAGIAAADSRAGMAQSDASSPPYDDSHSQVQATALSERGTLGAVERVAIASADALEGGEAWRPDASHLTGDWRAKRGASPLQQLAPLRAADGETALSGQVLTLHGRALENVTLSIGAISTRSDATGRFLLNHLTPGVQVLTIDGQSAGQAGARYGNYQVRVDINSHQTNVLDYTIWSPRLDPAGDISFPSPTQRDMVLSSPRIPGLELHIPAGTVIRDRKGKIVTAVNITAIPTDRPPFPIPSVGVPVYFTIQPGGATLTSAVGRMQGAQLIYPNFSGAAPGTRIDFWNYDTRTKGWYVYGKGTVTPNGKQVMPDAGVAIYEFTGAMISLPGNAPPDGPPPGGCGASSGSAAGSDDCNADPNQPTPPGGCAGDPVDCSTGLFLDASTDLFIADVIPLKVARSYRSRDARSRAFGIGANLSYDFFLVGDTSPWTYQDLILPDGGRIHYRRTSPGTSFTDAVYSHTTTATKYFGSTIRRGNGSCYWQLDMKNGARICFPESAGSANARAAAATSIRDRYGNVLTLERDGNSNLQRITSPSGRYLQFAYDPHNRITQASDNIGRVVKYEYDTEGHLAKATDPDGKSKAYTYDQKHNMLTVQDARGNSMVTNVYDVNSRISKQTYADGSTNLFAHELDSSGKVTRTDITDERGIITRMLFNSQGYTTSVTRAYGRPEQQVVTIERDPATNLMLSHTDALGRKTSYTYDGNGNMLTRTLLAGTAQAVTMRMSYTTDFNRVASVTDFLGHQSTMRYDGRGNLVETQDANGIIVQRSYNSAGQITQVVDGLGKSTSLEYDVFDLARITDPLSRVVQFYVDNAGRVRSITDALGNRSSYDIDVLDRVTRSTDPLGQSIGQDFDANGNPTGVTDPKGNLHKFAFDSRNALTENVNPLNQAEAYAYDAKHNLTQKTDRKGQVTRYAYDALDRLTSTTYADGGTVNITYDQGNRIVRMDDSVNGVVSFEYDGRDQPVRVSTPKGKVAYTFDANGRRASMSVTGLPTLRYSYDDGGRLIRIEQAAGAANNGMTQSISFVYDAANRRIRTTYANGVTRSDNYDDAGQLISIAYAHADGSVLGDLRYVYDNGGRRIETGGSLARTVLPDALAAAKVDAANRQIAFGKQTLSYDANGNLLGDGYQTYVWNARDQLSQIKNGSGAVVASFSYDALGRRQTKTVNGVASGYVYDGLNIVQELSGLSGDNSSPTNVRASYINGGIDEVFAQLGGTGASAKIDTYLTDALGSTIRLLDATGAKVIDYTYDPYGNTTSDAVGGNPFQYTGRENDMTGLYYYRARYYSPSLGRFISSDPIGLNGGINTYTYVGGDPIFRTDPLGENWNKIIPIVGCLIGLCNNPIIPDVPPDAPPPAPGQAPKPGVVNPKPKTLPEMCPADKRAGTPSEAPPINARPQPGAPTPPVLPPVAPSPWAPIILLFVPGNMFQNPFPNGNEIN